MTDDLSSATSAFRLHQGIDLAQVKRVLPSQQLRDLCSQETSALALAREALEPSARSLGQLAGELRHLVDPPYASELTRVSQLAHAGVRPSQTLASLPSIAVMEWQRLAGQLREHQIPQTIADLFSTMRDMALRVSDMAVQAREWLEPWHALVRHLHLWPERAEKCLLAMARAGWYPDEDLLESGLLDVEQTLDEDGQEALDAFMADYLRQALDGVEAALLTAHPHREKPIRAAFAAHRRGEYALSVLMLLVQADGICADITSNHLFSGGGAGRYTQGLDTNAVERAYLAPLNPQSRTPLFQSTVARGQEKRELLNRHAALHGENLNYTEELSLRAVSLLAFVSAALRRAREAKAA